MLVLFFINEDYKMDDYVLMLNSKGECVPYDVNQQHFLSYEYLFNVLKPKCSLDEFKYNLRFKLPTVAGTTFEPCNTAIVSYGSTHYLNTFKSYSPTTDKHQQADLTPLHALFERLFPIVEEREIVLNWISHLIQRPYEKPTYHLLLTGEQGTGKGTLCNSLISPLISNQLVSINSYSQLTGRFSDILADNLLIVLDDCRRGSHNTATALKSLLTEKRVYIERKGLQGRMVNTYSRFVLNSNDKLPIPIESNDRRWFIPQYMNHAIDRKETQAFISSFIKWLESNIDCVYWYFMVRDISQFNPNDCVSTATKEALQDKSTPSLVEYIQDYINTVWPYFSKAEINTYLKQQSVRYTQSELSEAVEAIGYECKQIRVKTDRYRICVPKDAEPTIIEYPKMVLF